MSASSRSSLGVVVLTVSVVAAVALSLLARRSDGRPSPSLTFDLRAVDETGRPIAGAVFSAGGRSWRTGASGKVRISATDEVLAGPLAAGGYLDEPVVVGPEYDRRVLTVRLWAKRGGRFSYHAAGDVMLGRRYLEPRPDATTATLDPNHVEESARAIVSRVAPIFAAATFSTVNLETVVGELPSGAAYPAKDLVIQTPPQALAALRELGVDAALGANNHVRDYRDAGIASTRRAVEARGIAYGGAGVDQAEAARPVRLSGSLVVLAFSGLTGDGVNDAYSGTVGGAWREFRRLERRDPAAATRAWPSLAAVYPELQDWVARRRHGGANAWDATRSTAAIRRAARGDAPVVVQLQRGFQYAPAPPSRLVEAAHAAIDAGADIVIAHHPHVLQGFEWYRGKLIAFSLGNFVFDQDLHVTYPGDFLRTVWEGDRLLEARFVPTILAGYRPLPVSGSTANRILRPLAAASLLPAGSSRRGSERTRLVPRRLAPGARVGVRIERNTLLLRRSPLRKVAVRRTVGPGQVQRLEPGRLYSWGDGVSPAGVLAGRDVLRYGSFDDCPGGVLQWRFGRATSREAERGNGYLVLRRSASSLERAVARPASRVPIAEASLIPASARHYELRFRARFEGEAPASVRLDFYRFDAGGLSIQTGSKVVDRRTVRLAIAPDRRWRQLTLPIDPPPGADYVLPHFVLEPTGKDAAFALDDVELVEWMTAAGPVHPEALDYLRNVGKHPAVVTLPTYLLRG